MRILLGNGTVDVPIVQENFYTIWVQLFDGHYIKRHKKKHCINFQEDKMTDTIPKIQPVFKMKQKSGFWNRAVKWIMKVYKQLLNKEK